MRADLSVASLHIRRDILQKIKKQVRLYLGEESDGVRKYALSYKKDIERSRWEPSSFEHVFLRMKESDVILGGDFHAFSQAQRVHLRYMRELVKDHQVIFATECIESRYQKVLDKYIRGDLVEEDFLKKVKWDSSWGFYWQHYKPLFDLIKESGGRCIALNCQAQNGLSGLRKRDVHAAKILAQAYKNLNKAEKIYVLYGDLHIAQKNLPAQLSQRTKGKCKTLTLYLNPEKIYFQLFKKNLENKINVVQFSKNQFCLLESPPWVKWQSYLLFLEENTDYSLEVDPIDYSEHLQSLVQIFAMDLQIPFHGEFSISSFKDHDFLDRLKESLDSKEFLMAKKLVENDMSFYCPQIARGYLARGTVNYASQLAGAIFHSTLCKHQKMEYFFPDDFEKIIWLDSVSFFLSKLINPHRKSSNMNDLKKQLAAFSPADKGEKSLKLALDQKMRELLLSYPEGRQPLQNVVAKKLDPLIYFNASKILGTMLG
ncbi:ChaN family lipoprotein, partial [bacterium]|nr:ChaN family lipoprotein [bacterium]